MLSSQLSPASAAATSTSRPEFKDVTVVPYDQGLWESVRRIANRVLSCSKFDAHTHYHCQVINSNRY